MTHPVTITGDFMRLQQAIEDELGNHWRTLQGLCQCGRSRSKDPAVWRAHMAEETMAVLMRFQPGRNPDEPVDDLLKRVYPDIGDQLISRFGTGKTRTDPEVLRDLMAKGRVHVTEDEFRREREGTWTHEPPPRVDPLSGMPPMHGIVDRSKLIFLTDDEPSTAVDNPVDEETP